MNPNVSIIMPVYNGEKYLQLAIESILNQTYKNFELIIINDGSTDNTENIINTFNDSRIIHIKNETNLKLIKSLNKGIGIARGKYIARMDADDISLPTRIEKQKNILDNFDGITLVNSRANKLTEDGRIKGLMFFHIGFEAIKYINIYFNTIIHPAIMIRSSIIKKYMYSDNIENEHIEDMELWNRLLLSGHICYTINESLLLYRNNPTGISNSWTFLQRNRIIALSSKLTKIHLNYMFEESLAKLLFGDISDIKYNDLSRLNRTLNNFVEIIINKKVISDNGISDLYYWKKYSVIKAALQLLINGKIKYKLESIFFLLGKWYWIKNYLYFIRKAF